LRFKKKPPHSRWLFPGCLLKAQLGNLILPGERLFFPKQTLKSVSWESENGARFAASRIRTFEMNSDSREKAEIAAARIIGNAQSVARQYRGMVYLVYETPGAKEAKKFLALCPIHYRCRI